MARRMSGPRFNEPESSIGRVDTALLSRFEVDWTVEEELDQACDTNSDVGACFSVFYTVSTL